MFIQLSSKENKPQLWLAKGGGGKRRKWSFRKGSRERNRDRDGRQNKEKKRLSKDRMMSRRWQKRRNKGEATIMKGERRGSTGQEWGNPQKIGWIARAKPYVTENLSLIKGAPYVPIVCDEHGRNSLSS